MANQIIDKALAYLGDKLFVRQTYTAQYTVDASSTASLTSTDFGISVPTGYQPLSLRHMSTGNGNITITSFSAANIGTTAAILGVRNLATSSRTATATIIVTFVKNGVTGIVGV